MSLQDELKALNEIVAGYDVLKQRISELEEQQVEQEQEFPRVGDEYWYLSSNGYIISDYNDGIDGIEVGLSEIGNMFRTKEQAEFEVEKLKVEAELRKFSRGYINGRNNWYILYDFDKGKVMRTNELHHYHQGVIYFSDTYTTREAIESVGEERIKKYIFGVEE